MNPPIPPANLLRSLYDSAVAAARPEGTVRRALTADPLPPGPIHIIALGKAAVAMAGAALELCGERAPGALAVAADHPPAVPPGLEVVVGDHPEPGAASVAAADRIAAAVVAATPGSAVLVLVSGGASSLAAGPVAGISADDLAMLNRRLLRSGLDIEAVNRIRRRVLRWGGGRLAAALPDTEIRCLILSDVVGGDGATIGSGPCTPDPTRGIDITGPLRSTGIWPDLPEPVRALLAAAGGGGLRTERARTAAVRTSIIGDNRTAVAGAAAAALALGLAPTTIAAPLTGAAAAAGAACAGRLIALPRSGRPACLIWGGETTVALTTRSGRGGRSQELALAAARLLAGTDGVTLLAAGTDGRDGPTDAAGAIVDGATWMRIIAAGRSPVADLTDHDAYAALDAAGALLRTGPTGTNVADLVIALRS